MSIKYFCDQCSNELTDENSVEGNRLKRQHKNLHFEIMVGPAAGPLNSGNWCKYCLIDAVHSCDDRPIEAK